MKFTPVDRVVLAALLAPLPRAVLRRLRLLVRPDTISRRHRDLLRRPHARASRELTEHPHGPTRIPSHAELRPS
ncbi:hypothetical protein [Streptomyces sp. NBC_01445]|uniref:hypothetical protein n=1 Tax=Streptomyces sp. NBC_01445 TaxID=2903869 RepID=UPI002DDB4908|nr:hypothetical protein [Streptomyces sp. NBC_01445]WSE10067.1 hypothetical protein OG574_46125 [Streptomyces sp. NBC_01445]